VTNALIHQNAFQTIDAIVNLANVGLRIVKILLDVKAKEWSALMDNVNLITLSGELHVRLMTTVLVMLSPVMKDYAGVLNVLKELKSLETLLKMIPLLLILLLLLLLLL